MKHTTLCYIEQDGRYLMLNRNKKENDPNHGKWIGVGGKLEAGESPDDCLLREVREETGLTLTRYTPRGFITFVSDSFGTEYMHLYTADEFTGTLTACAEGTLAWVPIEDLLSLPLWEGDAVFLSLLQQSRPYFSLKLCYDARDRLTAAVLDGIALSK